MASSSFSDRMGHLVSSINQDSGRFAGLTAVQVPEDDSGSSGSSGGSGSGSGGGGGSGGRSALDGIVQWIGQSPSGPASGSGTGPASRRRDYHSAAPPSPSTRRFNRDDEGVPVKRQSRRRLGPAGRLLRVRCEDLPGRPRRAAAALVRNQRDGMQGG